MKIIGINASPRGDASRTKRLVLAVLEGAGEEGAETEFIDLCKYRIEFCTGCGACFANGTCIHEDDFCELHEMILAADGIVLGSPVYIDNVTAQLKTFLDRLADAIHCQMLHGKYGCAVATTGGAGDKEIIEYMCHVLNWLGAVAIGGVGVALGPDPEAIVPAEGRGLILGRDLARAIRERRSFPDQEEIIEKTRERFKNLVIANRDTWWHEYEYWVERGWID